MQISVQPFFNDNESRKTADQDVAYNGLKRQTNRRGRDAHRLLARNRQVHTISDLDRDQSFSWVRCFVSLVSYALLLSDVLRTGLGIRKPLSTLVPVEPDTKIYIGPTSYSVIHLTTKNSTHNEASVGYWLYKYDTTSIGMRALAELFKLTTWPRCVLYEGQCDESRGLPRASVFAMIDSLVGAVSRHVGAAASHNHSSAQRRLVPGHITVRSENVFRDRLHHFALPWFFQQTIKRTNQAIHHPLLANVGVVESLCGSLQSPRPFSCQENWTRSLPGKCHESRTLCDGHPRIWEYIPMRLKLLAEAYPDHVVDYVVLEGMEDYTRAAMTYQGRRFFEIVLLSRVRLCTNAVCQTVAVDDYRFESAGLVMNADSWFLVVASLRVVGQAYTWLRVMLIVLVCHRVRRFQSLEYRRSSMLAQLRSIVRTIFLIPSQVVIYGSMVPITLYVLAHLLDSPAVYEMVAIRFSSVLGEFKWVAADFFGHCAVSMRTVWVLSFMCHLALSSYTKCVWSPTSGIPGVPELFISFVASLTIFAQYRSLSLRNTRVLQVQEVVPSYRAYLLRSDAHGAPRSVLMQLLFGSPIDYECIQSALISLVAISVILRILKFVLPRSPVPQLSIVSHSFGPYSAGTLWPPHRLVVSWPDLKISDSSAYGPSADARRRGGTLANISVRATIHNGLLERHLSMSPPYALIKRGNTTARTSSLHIRQEMQSIVTRTRQFESAAYLINLAVMTDPITMLKLRVFKGPSVGLYESKVTKQCILVPYDLRQSSADIAIEWDQLSLVAVVNTNDLEWDDLLRCG